MGGGLVAVLVPHFDLPFRLSGSSFAVVEQDSSADVANCVEAIVRTPNGFRDDTPDFGMDDITFANQPLNLERLTAQIESQEPRASVALEQHPSLVDELVTKLVINANDNSAGA